MATSTIKQMGWKLVATSTAGNTVTFTDLATQGFSEVFVKAHGAAGTMIPVIALPTNGYWGGLHSGGNGTLWQITVTKTSMKGVYARVDSADQLASTTWSLYAR